MSNFVWTLEMDAALAEGWGTKSTRQLAKEIGVSVGSLVGRAFRLYLPRHEKPKAIALAELRRDPLRVLGSARYCRYIFGEPENIMKPDLAHFCAKRTLEGEAFCREHFDLCYIPEPEGTRKLLERLARIADKSNRIARVA